MCPCLGDIKRIFAGVFSNPAAVAVLFNRTNARKLLSACRAYGIKGAMEMGTTALRSVTVNTDPCIGDFTEGVDVDDPTPLEIPRCDRPLVSIIIPVHNQFLLTYCCIRSIIETSSDIDYEIILGDDNSTDQTIDAHNIFEGVTVVRNVPNLGFTLNCNHAATKSRGKYLLFLNNDTIVRPNWLSSLVDVMESDDSVGMVGSKFLFPDGSLQEAGGIVWSDGAIWNYGRGQNPGDPEFNYLRETDYISGASIMISSALWNEIGGFDERYAPAYCEDTDLAFEVRKRGKKVVYQPRSEVIHFEGASNGKSVSSGLKAYQVVNTEKFYDKWGDVIRSDGYKQGSDLFHARDRSRDRHTMLIIDSSIPSFDRDAGSRNIDCYIQILVEMGYNVKLFPANFIFIEEYARRYEGMGVEVLYGWKMYFGWENWLKRNGQYIDNVMILRPDNAERFMGPVKTYCPHANIIYHTCDLHYVRLLKQYECTGDERFRKESESCRILEHAAIQDSDVVLSLNDSESRIIDDIAQSDKAVTVPIYYFDPVDSGDRDYAGTKDILFVGGFRHLPNADAVLWFISKIWPFVKDSVPGVKFHVVGNHPPEEVLSLASDDVVIHGYVSDAELDQLYRECSVCVVPLRFGAGVKGKTVEAMYKKIPLVSTSIGVEGMPGVESYVTVSDSPDGFAKEVIRLCLDRDDAEREASAYIDYMRENFSKDVVRTKLMECLSPMEHTI